MTALRASLALAGGILVLAAVSSALGGGGTGPTPPAVSLQIAGEPGLARLSTVVRDRRTGRPVERVRVAARVRMTTPHVMELPPVRLTRHGPGRYGTRVALPMAGDWHAAITVAGANIDPASLSLRVPREVAGG